MNNDKETFALLMERYREQVISFILKYVNVREDAEDICQRSFEKAFFNISLYDEKYAFSTWIYTIARNEAIDHLRKNKASVNAVSLTTAPEMLNAVFSDTPENKVISEQSVAEMIDKIRNLPEGYRRVAELRFIKDFAYEDIAAELGLPLGTVKTKINRARKMLTQQ